MEKSLILVIEDRPEIRALIVTTLENNGYSVIEASSGHETLSQLRVRKPDMILLDLALPDTDGLNLISSIRKLTAAPIMVVSGKGNIIDKVVGLEMGADDYISKPFDLNELKARVRASVRRYKAAQDEGASNPARRRIRFDGWMLDEAQYQAFDRQGISCGLTTTEFKLLAVLVRSPQQVFSREQLLEAISNEDLDINDRAVDSQVNRLRKKLGDDAKDPQLIRTVRSIGYMLACDTEVL